MSEVNHEPYIETLTGKRVHFLNPSLDELDIFDIAGSLGNQCRYTGHCKFYSVAEHSILVSSMVPDHHKFTALMHDASEAYLTDVATPVKRVLDGRYYEIENTLMTALAEKFGFTWPLPDVVKWADRRALAMEAKQMLPSKGEDWTDIKNLKEPVPDIKIQHLLPPYGAMLFLKVFNQVSGIDPFKGIEKKPAIYMPPTKGIITNA